MEASERRPRRPLLAGGERLSRELERSSGGGEPYHPHTLDDAVALLTPQIRHLQDAVSGLQPDLRGERVVFEAKVLPNYLANSHFPKELFAEANLMPVGTRGGQGEYRTRTRGPEPRSTKTYLLAGTDASIARVDAILHGEPPSRPALVKARNHLRQFDLVRLPSAAETLRVAEPVEDQITWEAVLHPAVNEAGRLSDVERHSILSKWLKLVRRLDGEVAERYVRTIKDLTFVPVRLSADAVREAAKFNPLRAIRPMPAVRPAPIGPFRVVATPEPAPEAPADNQARTDRGVAVFDGGVDDSLPALAPFVRAIDLTTEPPDPRAVAHGTLVTSALLYGAEQDGAQLPTPDVAVDHFRVFPVPPEAAMDLDLYWILEQIEERVVRNGYGIINLSLGPDCCVDDDEEPHAWTARLDELAEQHGALFVSAVGNNGEGDPVIGAHRVQAPADMVNGVGIGASDAPPPENPWQRAPYSAIGPGRPGARVQPLAVAFGGVAGRPFRGIIPGNVVGEACGTSFATPAAGHALSSLAATIGGVGDDPQVLRAFAAHFAERPDDPAHEEVGYGRLPGRFDDLLDCGTNEAVVLYRDSINRGQALSLPFPLPEAEVGGRMVEFRWTIAFAAPTDPKDPVDYTQAGLEASFRPHAETLDFRHPDTKEVKTVDVRADPSEATRLMRAGFNPGALPKARPPQRYRHETERRRDEGKWETILSFSASKRASSLLRPQATIVYLARDEGALSAAPPLEFAMLLTMRTHRDVALYDAVRTGFQVLTPLRTELPLRV